MKVRVCPNCGKHNEEDAFSCADCGTTLSMKTLMDVNSGQLLNVKPIAGYTKLADISPYFEQDVVEVIKKVIPINEPIVWGCNITHLARLVPMAVTIILGNNFLFGYLIITGQRLICVYFESDLINGKPTRACLEIWATLNSFQPIVSVGQPGFKLSSRELSSRQVAIYPLSDLISVRLESKGAKDVSLTSLIIKLKQGNETSITFYGMHEAEKTQKLLAVK